MLLDASVREAHFLDHLAPVWRALDDHERGTLWVDVSVDRYARQLGLPHKVGEPDRSDVPTLCAAWSDMRRARRVGRPVVMMEHGAGQTYLDSQANSYVGGNRDGVSLVLLPNWRAAEKHFDAHPGIEFEVVGCPKLDDLVGVPAPGTGAVAVSHHWDGVKVSPECRSAYSHYSAVYPTLARQRTMFGHPHPKAWLEISGPMSRAGLVMLRKFSEVVEQADLFVTDNSSCLFEFAALDRPVVVLNAPWYRRDVHHGGRFWEWADIGIQVDEPSELDAAIRRALDDPPEVAERRRQLVTEIYPNIGSATQSAVDALRSHNLTVPKVSRTLSVPKPSR